LSKPDSRGGQNFEKKSSVEWGGDAGAEGESRGPQARGLLKGRVVQTEGNREKGGGGGGARRDKRSRIHIRTRTETNMEAW